MATLSQRLFPSSLWNRTTVAAWLTVVFKLLLFDVIWCGATTFTAFQYPELYLNTLLLSLVLAAPVALAGWRRVQAVVFVLLDLWLVCNLMYCRTYASAIPLPSYLLIGNLADFTDSVADQLRWIDILFPATTVAGISLLFSSGKAQISGRDWLVYSAYVGVLLIVTVTVNLLKGGFVRSYESFNNANVFSCTTPVYTLAGKLLHDYLKSSTPLSEAEKADVEQWMASTPPLEAADSVKSRELTSVVFILCESLESWVIDRSVGSKEITPNLNRLIADSTALYFSHVMSQVADGRSIDGQLLLLSGLKPLQSGAWSTDFATNTFYTLPRAMKELRGTRNYLLTVDKDVTWNQRSVARSFGIDTLLHRDCWVNDQPVGSRRKLGDRSFFNQIAGKMDAGEVWPEGERAFIQIVTYSGHNPYRLPQELKLADFSGDYPERIADYMTMANFTDAAIGSLVDYLKARPDYANTLIVITGDHEGLSSDRSIIDSSPAASWLGDAGRYTPLIVLNSPVAGRSDATIGQVDVYPTLLSLLGLEQYPWHGAGESAIPLGRVAYAVGNNLEIEGDTAGIDPARLRHAIDARRISDLILRHDLLNASRR